MRGRLVVRAAAIGGVGLASRDSGSGGAGESSPKPRGAEVRNLGTPRITSIDGSLLSDVFLESFCALVDHADGRRQPMCFIHPAFRLLGRGVF